MRACGSYSDAILSCRHFRYLATLWSLDPLLAAAVRSDQKHTSWRDQFSSLLLVVPPIVLATSACIVVVIAARVLPVDNDGGCLGMNDQLGKGCGPSSRNALCRSNRFAKQVGEGSYNHGDAEMSYQYQDPRRFTTRKRLQLKTEFTHPHSKNQVMLAVSNKSSCSTLNKCWAATSGQLLVFFFSSLSPQAKR